MDPAERPMYEAAIGGNRDAFENVIRSTSRQLFAIAYGILQNREEAEDAVQDALVKAWRSRWRVRDAEKFPAWLGTIARHGAHDMLRRRRSRQTVSLEAADLRVGSDEELDGLKPSSSAPSFVASLVSEAEAHAQVHSALAGLPELHRSAVALRYLERMDYAAIERTLGLTNGALRGILGRALGRLRKQLKPALAAMS